MMGAYVPYVQTKEEYEEAERLLDTLTGAELEEEIRRSWDNIFIVESKNKDFSQRGRYVQATFWEIKEEYIAEKRLLRPNK